MKKFLYMMLLIAPLSAHAAENEKKATTPKNAATQGSEHAGEAMKKKLFQTGEHGGTPVQGKGASEHGGKPVQEKATSEHGGAPVKKKAE